MNKIVSALSTLAFVLTGCGSNVDHQEVRKAPKNNSELGWITTNISAKQHTELMIQHPASSFRNHGKGFAYEYRGLSKAEILEVAPSANVEKNAFIPPQSAYQFRAAPAEERLDSFLAQSPEVEFAPQNCVRNTLLVTPRIKLENVSAVFGTETPEVGSTLGFKNTKAPDDDSLTAWMILPPNGSMIASELLGNESISFQPDMSGPHAIVLMYKKNGQCNFRRFDFFVTNNTPYSPVVTPTGRAKLELLAHKNFYQVSHTNADLAQELIKNLDLALTKIAVLDSGVNYNNPALKRRMWTNPNEVQGDGIDNDQNGLVDDFVGYDFADDDSQPMDDYGHGSHVAGLIAGEYMGTSAENVQIMAVKIGGSRGPDLGSIISGILYAIENEAKVINMSFGSPQFRESIQAAIQKASDAGILVVAASGNGNMFGIGVNNDLTPHYPSSYEFSNILSVGSVRSDDILTSYSNYGFESVDVATVGGFSTRTSGPAGLLSSAYIANPAGILTQPMAGTSMASPVAAGVAGLILSLAPELSPGEVIDLMMETGRKVPGLADKIQSGSILNAEAAVLSLLNPTLN